jgi:hypothetical protein
MRPMKTQEAFPSSTPTISKAPGQNMPQTPLSPMSGPANTVSRTFPHPTQNGTIKPRNFSSTSTAPTPRLAGPKQPTA